MPRAVWRVVMVPIALVVTYAAFASLRRSGAFSQGSGFDTLATTLVILAVVANLSCGIALQWLRPRNRSGAILFTLGLAVGFWARSFSWTGRGSHYAWLPVLTFRPLLFWVVLAWPIGRLARSARGWLLVYSAALTSCWASWLLLDPGGPGSQHDFENWVAVFHLPRLSAALNSFGSNVVMPAGALVVVVAVVRRFRRLPPAGRALMRPALVAGVFAAVGDILLLLIDRYLGDLTSHAGERTLLGGVLAVVDFGRFAAVPVLLGWAAWRSRRRAPADRLRSVEIGPAAERVEDAIALAVGDDSVRVVYHRDGAGWFDADGAPAEIGGAGRRVTMVERSGTPIAAVECDELLDDRPTTLELAVAAAASSIEHDRLAAVARSRLRDAYAARRTILDVEDVARRRIERDLHDGAQQRLVGLALQASLAARDGDVDVVPLADGVAQARAELRDLASGSLPSLLVERGLTTAVSTLAATTPLSVDVRLAVPGSLPAEVAATAWFVVAEAIANVVKHADATAIRIEGGVTDGRLVVTVADDGTGGADTSAGSGLRGLQARAESCGGHLVVESQTGRGTALRLEVPVAA